MLINHSANSIDSYSYLCSAVFAFSGKFFMACTKNWLVVYNKLVHGVPFCSEDSDQRWWRRNVCGEQ